MSNVAGKTYSVGEGAKSYGYELYEDGARVETVAGFATRAAARAAMNERLAARADGERARIVYYPPARH